MASAVNKLSATFVARSTRTGFHNDGAGLYLQVAPGPHGVTQSWVFRYKLHGVQRWMGLGSVNTFGLVEAREQARLCRQLIHQGTDPIQARKDKRAAVKAEQAKRLTFKEAAAGYIADNQSSWRSEVHLNQWNSSLTRYVYPVLGDLQVSDIETAHITKILRPIWTTKAPTASRVRGRVEAILNWATANGNRVGDNPSRWEGFLEHILPKQAEVEAEHHAALPYSDLPPFFARLTKTEGLPARALETLILTATRMGDVLGAKLNEFDIAHATWIIPPHTRNGDGRTTKTGKEHRVPLAPHLIALLKALPRSHSELAFPCGHNTVRDLLHKILPDGVHATLHGFRSSFAVWAHEHDKSSKFTEAALQHSDGNKVKRAYQRSDSLNQRRSLMMDWERFCLSAR
jgi:integrase